MQKMKENGRRGIGTSKNTFFKEFCCNREQKEGCRVRRLFPDVNVINTEFAEGKKHRRRKTDSAIQCTLKPALPPEQDSPVKQSISFIHLTENYGALC